MTHEKIGRAHAISVVVAILAALQSASGLLADGLYRDNLLVTSGWRGNDLVTLVVAVPTLVVSLILSRRGSWRGRLIWLGMLDFMLYNYAFYLFAAAFNNFFLVYVALFTLSILALIFGLAGLPAGEIADQFHIGRARKWISAFMLFVACGLTLIYAAQSVGFIVTGELPEIVQNTGHPTSVVFALDLSLVVAFFILGAIWLWQGRPWGYVVATAMNVKGAVYNLVLIAVTLSAFRAGAVGDLSQIGVWGAIGVGCLVSAWVLLGGLRAGR